LGSASGGQYAQYSRGRLQPAPNRRDPSSQRSVRKQTAAQRARHTHYVHFAQRRPDRMLLAKHKITPPSAQAKTANGRRPEAAPTAAPPDDEPPAQPRRRRTDGRLRCSSSADGMSQAGPSIWPPLAAPAAARRSEARRVAKD